MARVFRGPPAGALVAVDLDAFTALHHRPSGTTHLLASPAPELLAALAEPATLDALLRRLAREYDLTDPDRAALAARLDELVEAGLVAAT